MQIDKNTLLLDLFAYGDFSGLLSSEEKADPISVKSRTGILLTFVTVPTL